MSAGARGALAGRLVRRLVDLGVIPAEAALAGQVAVEDVSRSNHVIRVLIGGEPVAVVKHAPISADGICAFSTEVTAYRWLGRSAASAWLAPRLLGEMKDEEALVVAPVLNARSLHEALAQTPHDSDAFLGSLGRMLATLHRADPDDCWSPGTRRPWVLDILDGRVPAMLAGSRPVLAATERIRGHASLREAILKLGRDWGPTAIVHGDLKFDNVLVAPEREADGSPSLWLIDWELAGWGEPAWDLAGVVDGLALPYLVDSDADPPTIGEALARAAPALTSYRSVVGSGQAPSSTRLARAVVVRMAQTAVQLAAMSHETPEAAEASVSVLAGVEMLADELDGALTILAGARC